MSEYVRETGAVPPALTADQWQQATGDPLTVLATRHAAHLIAAPTAPVYDPAVVTALANAARDDADPGKLTWDDVDALEDVIDYGAGVRSVIAKLAALLPPREGA